MTMPTLLQTAVALLLCVAGCGVDKPQAGLADQSPAATTAPPADAAPPPETTGGFDGARAFAHVEKLVAIGQRVPGSEGIGKAQEYIREQLAGYGCAVEEDDFQASTPRGRMGMKNILAKIPGTSANILLLLTHYDTFNLPGFVGANDSGSSTGVMLEMARLLCAKQPALTVWIAFLDGEEAFVQWSDTDGTFGSRQLAAKMSLASELKRVKAVILADLVGYKKLRFAREENSTPWLVELVWDTAARLGYQDIFVNASTAAEDDHTPFLRRGVAAVDIIQLDDYPYWHTTQDTLDKISPRSLAVTGHVILESVAALEKRFR